MKKILALPVIILLSTLTFAQKIKVQESREKIGDGSNNAMVVIIYGADDKDVERAWKDLVKKYKPEKVFKKGDVVADNATISSISLNTMDIYARAEKDGENAKFIVGFDLGGVFLSKSMHSSEYKTAERIVYDFAIDQAIKAVEAELKEAEKEQNKMGKDMDKLVKDNEKLHSNIEKWTDQIEQAKKDIETNVKDQENKKKEIEYQIKHVGEIKDKKSKIQ